MSNSNVFVYAFSAAVVAISCSWMLFNYINEEQPKKRAQRESKQGIRLSFNNFAYVINKTNV